MKYGIALFTYNRPETTRAVLDSLQKNKIKELYVFQDGIKDTAHLESWNETRKLIDSIKWCKVNKFYSDVNKGLAESIISGVSKVFEQNEAVIVIEDDCILRDDYIRFMEACFLKYKDDKEILSVSGYSWPLKVPNGYKDVVYGTYRACSWGWGTWKDRWELYERNYRIIHDIKGRDAARKNLEDYGWDLEETLKANVSVESSWAVFWALCGIKYNMKSICPIENMVSNIGYGGNSGVHGSRKTAFARDINEKYADFSELPDEIVISDDIRTAYKRMLLDYTGRSLAERLSYSRNLSYLWIEIIQEGVSLGRVLADKGIKSCVIFGADKEAELLVQDLKKCIEVEYLVISNTGNEKERYGIPLYNYINDDYKNEMLIVIPGYDIKNIECTFELSKVKCVHSLLELLERIKNNQNI